MLLFNEHIRYWRGLKRRWIESAHGLPLNRCSFEPPQPEPNPRICTLQARKAGYASDLRFLWWAILGSNQ